MSYYETFEILRKALRKVNFENGDRHLAIQVTITDEEASGVFYIEDLGDRVLAEPYNYYDNDADITSESSTLLKLFEKKLDFEKALEDGIIIVNGDINALEYFFNRIIKTPAKRGTSKKSTTKTTTKSTTKKNVKTEVKKVKNDKNKVTKPKDSETIKEVVEKEIKPKK
jgi:hypothetical protein